ncbi:hypothetical protein ACTS95_14875 [Empedobacter brevis]
MSKITVKRYLNKKLKPTLVYDDIELGYNLYYSITYKRKTQNLKSLLGAVMTEKAFEHLEATGEPLHRETNYTNYTPALDFKLSNELSYLVKAVEYLTENGIKDIFDADFTNELKDYFNSLQETLYFIGWLRYDVKIMPIEVDSKPIKEMNLKELYAQKFEETDEEKRIKEAYKDSKNDLEYIIEQFYYIFNKEKNLLDNLEIFSDVTKINLEKYFYTDTLKLWYVIKLILNTHQNSLRITFLIDFDIDKYIKQNKKLKYPVTDLEIKNISNLLRNSALYS